MRIFFTGATGVIGRRAIPLCLARGHEVTAVARSAEGRAALERLGARAVAADLFDRDQLSTVLHGHDAVVNLATHMPASSLRMVLPGAWRENDRLRREASAAVADDEPLTHRGFVDSLAEALGVSPPRLPPSWMTVLGGSRARTLARSLRVSNRKLKAASGWAPVFRTVRDGWLTAVGPLIGGKTVTDLRAATRPEGRSQGAKPGARTPPTRAP